MRMEQLYKTSHGPSWRVSTQVPIKPTDFKTQKRPEACVVVAAR